MGPQMYLKNFKQGEERMEAKTIKSIIDVANEILDGSENIKFEIWANYEDKEVFAIALTPSSWTINDNEEEKLLLTKKGMQGKIRELINEALYQNYEIEISDIEEENYPDAVKEYMSDIREELKNDIIQEILDEYKNLSK